MYRLIYCAPSEIDNERLANGQAEAEDIELVPCVESYESAEEALYWQFCMGHHLWYWEDCYVIKDGVI